MKKGILLLLLLPLFSLGGAISIHPQNPHYFLSPEGEPLLLTGVYTWDIFSDPQFDHKGFFKLLKANSLNFARVWLFWGWEKEDIPFLPLYQRTGPGEARDGKSRYDLDKFNPFFFQHLKDVLESAKKEGIYLQLVLFDAWSLKNKAGTWDIHCFHRDNNINGVDGDKDGDGRGTEFCSLKDEKILAYQKRFVDEILKICAPYDNIFFEVANENYYDPEWERFMGNYIKEKEKNQRVRHLVMPLDLPNHDGAGIKTWDLSRLKIAFRKSYALNQPLIMDTDGIGSPSDDVIRRAFWTAFASGGHFDYLDETLSPQRGGKISSPKRANLYRQLGHIARFAKDLPLPLLEPHDEVVLEGNASVLARLGERYIVYLPFGGEVKIRLGEGDFLYRWFDPRTGEWSKGKLCKGERARRFKAPSNEDWVLYMERKR